MIVSSVYPRVSLVARSSIRTFAASSSVGNNATNPIYREAMLSIFLGMISSGGVATVALCDDGKSDGGGGDDILKKLKSMVPSADGDGGFDVKAIVDKVAKDVGSKVAEAVETGVPTQLSYGFVSGFGSGYALKKVGKAAAVVFGLGFMALQTLSYSGYIEVDHEKLKKDIEGMMDLNNDGAIDKEDLNMASENIMEVLQFGLPAGGGFAAGFIFGLRQG